jgi:hypothetical protein
MDFAATQSRDGTIGTTDLNGRRGAQYVKLGQTCDPKTKRHRSSEKQGLCYFKIKIKIIIIIIYGTSSPVLRPVFWILKIFDFDHLKKNQGWFGLV